MAYSAAFSQSIAILAYIDISSTKEDCKYLSIKNISEQLSIPVPSIKRLISMLKRNGLLDTKAGVDGGLALSNDDSKISLFDIFNAIEGINNPLFKIYKDFDFKNFEENKSKVENILDKQERALSKVELDMEKSLKNISLKDIVDG
ncbi:Rrf2 family transcriptional regulator [Apilactobacillus quenuiae]|uniref:Rrf2 family transcriptional regulator n=1 Tax=Apilactobacillus quenuiae TaxID=2008377 RepID=UPI000D01EA80|nr:Rrf2 family transcriptional regulator [Apilactobacillus quenuiae]